MNEVKAKSFVQASRSHVYLKNTKFPEFSQFRTYLIIDHFSNLTFINVHFNDIKVPNVMQNFIFLHNS